MALRPRLLAVSLGVAVVVSGVAGWALSRSDGPGASGGNGDSTGVTLSGPGVVQDPTIGTNKKVAGRSLPTVGLVDEAGNRISSHDLVGHPLVINVWFSTCGPCKGELPGFAKVQTELGDKIRFVGINPSDTAETNSSFAHQLGVHYELLRDPDGAFVDATGIVAFPVTLFVAADGTIVRQTGVLTEGELRSDAQALLG
jgi:thiol-disulfide isomerase/thioredoxin